MAGDSVKVRPSVQHTLTASTSPAPTSNAERRLRRKIDLYTVPIVANLYALCTIDRINIGNALLSIFYISYVLFSIPATYVIEYLGPGWVLPGTTLAFGILTTAFAFTTLFNPFYPNLVLEYVNNASLQADYTGYADNINFVLPWTGQSQVLSMPQREITFTGLVFQGYFAPQLTGTWNFPLFSNDDVTNIWMGSESYANWNTGNRLLRGTRGNIFSYIASFDGGELVPITILYANGPQTGCLQLGTTDPAGTYHNSTAGLFKWPSCASDNFLKYPVANPEASKLPDHGFWSQRSSVDTAR